MKKLPKILSAAAAICLGFTLLAPTAEANSAQGGKTCRQTEFVILRSRTPNPTNHVHIHTSTSGHEMRFKEKNTTAFSSAPGWYKSKWRIETTSVEPISHSGRCVATA